MPTKRRPQQTRLTFTPLPSSSPAAKDYNKQIQERAAQVGYDAASHQSTKRRKLREADQDGYVQVDGANDMPTPTATNERAEEEESEDEKVMPSQRRRRSRQQRIDFTSRRDPSTFSSPVRLSSPSKPQSSSGMFGTQTRGRRVKKPVHIPSESESSAEEDLPTTKSQKMNRRGSQKPVLIDSDDEEEDTVVVNNNHQDEEEDGDSGEDMPTTQGKLPRPKRARSRDSFISSSPPRAVDSDDDLEIVSTSKRRTADSDDEPVTPSRRKKLGRKLTRQDEEDLAEDLDFLDPSSDVEALERAPRSTQSKAKSAREAALAKLKRKRSGQPAEAQVVVHDDDEESDADNGDIDDEPIPQPTSSRQYFEAGAEDEDFIEEEEGDGDGLLGVPDGMPIEFTHFARKKPKELFKYAVEWMVQKKINPGFNMYDDVYQLTFRKLDDELQGLAGSKFRSSAWTQPFTMALKARPEVAIDKIDRMHELPDHCDACNRSKHPATFEMQFQGKPYHPYTLEPVTAHNEVDDDEENEDTSSEASSEDENIPGRNHEGNQIPPAATIYQVGKFCKANALMAHNLQHWKFHLNATVEVWLSKDGHLSNEKIVARERKSLRKRKREANKLSDAMEAEGQVRELWGMYRANADEARNAKQGHFSVDSP